MPDHHFFATAPKGIAPLLAAELKALGATVAAESVAGVGFSGSLAVGYAACLWSRTASRVLLYLTKFEAPTPEALYAGIQSIGWDEHLAAAGTLAVDFNSRRSRIAHTQFGAQKVKDAIVDQFRQRCGSRPAVDLERPDLRVNVFVDCDVARVAIDLSGEALHRRGYRADSVTAPLKENLAAAILIRCGWPEIARAGGALVDPMCGSGTLAIEAALIAGDIAPGLSRVRFGFLGWRQHDPRLWADQLAAEQERRAAAPAGLPLIHGYDADPRAIRAALANRAQVGLAATVHFERREVAALEPPAGSMPGLVIVNPPYGERLGEAEQLAPLYEALGARLRARFEGWEAAVFTGNPPLGKALGINAHRTHTFFNGAIECRLLRLKVVPAAYERSAAERAAAAAAKPRSPGAEMFANRLRKNLRDIGRWAEREAIDCFRLYDADMPEYALAIDVYRARELHLHVQEYAPPPSIDPEKARTRRREALGVLPALLAVPRERIHLRRRERQRGAAQYRKRASTGEFHEVREGPCRFLVNFDDYLDTGLFLDHRLTRAMIGDLARGRTFLNLFCYTATATVYAALGGAAASTSVDMSATYLAWARRNLDLNAGDRGRHDLVQADCLEWLNEARHRSRRYGLIFLDPPTFSNSKRMGATLDIQRDHVDLIGRAAGLLEPDGVLLFSTNRQKFRLDTGALAGWRVEDISAATIPKDFERNPHIHRCYRITAAR